MGKKLLVPYARPVRIEFENRIAFVGAMFLGDEVLFGAIPIKIWLGASESQTKTIGYDLFHHSLAKTVKLSMNGPINILSLQNHLITKAE